MEGVPEQSYRALAARYGHGAHEVLALARERGELAQPIVAGLPDLLAEVALAARREQARTIGDVLLRRTRLGLLAARELTATDPPGAQGEGPVRRVGHVLARELHWSAERLELELQHFAQEANAEGILAEVQRPPAEERSAAEQRPAEERSAAEGGAPAGEHPPDQSPMAMP